MPATKAGKSLVKGAFFHIKTGFEKAMTIPGFSLAIEQ